MIETSVTTWFKTTFVAPAGVTFDLAKQVRWPRQKIDTSKIESWVELYVENTTRPRQRSRGKDTKRLLLLAHCFVKTTAKSLSVADLADAVADVFDQQLVTVTDYGSDGLGTTRKGTVRFAECELIDNTQEVQDAEGSEENHFLVRVDGRVYAI